MIVYVIIPRGFFSKNNHPLGKNVHFSRAGSEGPKKKHGNRNIWENPVLLHYGKKWFFHFF